MNNQPMNVTEKNEFEYPKPIQDAVKVLCEILCKHYPEVFNKTYDSIGMPCSGGALFEKRMEMALYIELVKAGERFDAKPVDPMKYDPQPGWRS